MIDVFTKRVLHKKLDNSVVGVELCGIKVSTKTTMWVVCKVKCCGSYIYVGTENKGSLQYIYDKLNEIIGKRRAYFFSIKTKINIKNMHGFINNQLRNRYIYNGGIRGLNWEEMNNIIFSYIRESENKERLLFKINNMEILEWT